MHAAYLLKIIVKREFLEGWEDDVVIVFLVIFFKEIEKD